MLQQPVYACFRPQQGLPIMNPIFVLLLVLVCLNGFRPQQGLPIMNLNTY